MISLGLGNEIEDLFQQLDCRVMTFQRHKQVDFQLLHRVRDFIRNENIDIVMTTLFYADVLGAMAGHSGGAKGVFSWETISSPKWLVPHRLWSYRYAIRRADKVISVSKATAKWLVEKRKVNPDKVLIIPYGVNLDKFNPNIKSVKRRDIGLEQDDIVIGQVSRLNEQKGHTYLIDAAPAIIARQPRVKFVLVGDGPLRAELTKKIQDKGVEDHFVLLGFRQDVPELLPLFDVFTLPSLYEGLPNVVLEAMACGLPVVATPVDGTKEAVIDQETGFLVPVGDTKQLAEKLLDVISNDDLKLKLGLAGRRRVEDDFSLDGQVKRFENLYKEYALRN